MDAFTITWLTLLPVRMGAATPIPVAAWRVDVLTKDRFRRGRAA